MARGKYRQRSCAQRARRLRDEIGALEADVAGEERALREAREQAAKTRAARRRLGAETARTSTVLAPKEAEAARGACATAGAWRDLKAASVELERADRALSDPRQGHARADLLAAAVAGGFVLDNRSVAHAGSSPEYQELICRTRVGTSVPMRRGIDMTGWLPTDLRDADADRPNSDAVTASGAPGADRAAISPYAQATVHDQTREALWSFVVPPWTRVPDGADAPTLRAALGATSSGAAGLPDSPFPGVAPRAMTIDRPWRHTPWLAAPEDAADLAYWYHRAAWAQSWAHLHTPVPFWLPAEHSSGFPRAKPLPDDVDLRLPFPLVCALFAQPWELPATRPAAELPFATLLLARGQAVDSRVQAVVEHRRRVLVGRDELPTGLECVEHFGAEVEGLLLRADRDHRPSDDFAWCLSLSHPWGLPLGRVVVPARRSTTAWRQAVDNVLGGVCLSHWHTPDSGSSILAPRSDHHARAISDIDVRVLDVAATSPGQHNTDATPSGSRRRAHLRRGTWRWQWVGPGRTRQRPTWVRDTVVRGNGSVGHQVYRLPRDQP